MDVMYVRGYNVTVEKAKEFLERPKDGLSGCDRNRNCTNVYGLDDGKKLLDFIRTFEMHAFVKGKQIWEILSEIDIINKGMSASSLEAFFNEKVLKNLDLYEATAEDEKKFAAADAAIARGEFHELGSREQSLFLELEDIAMDMDRMAPPSFLQQHPIIQ